MLKRSTKLHSCFSFFVNSTGVFMIDQLCAGIAENSALFITRRTTAICVKEF
jgi:hypothetical protein